MSRIREPAVVLTPRVTITSLIATGTPASGGSGFPSLTSASISAALVSARSLDSVKNAPISPSCFWIASKKDKASDVAVAVPSATAERAVSIVRVLRFIGTRNKSGLAYNERLRVVTFRSPSGHERSSHLHPAHSSALLRAAGTSANLLVRLSGLHTRSARFPA